MRFLLALAMSALTVQFLVASGRLALRQELGSTARMAVGAVLLVLVLTLTVYTPVVAFGRVADIDMARLNLPLLFLGHFVLAAFVLFWWLLRRDPASLTEYLSLRRHDRASLLRYGLIAGVSAWLLAIVVNLTIALLLAPVLPASDPLPLPPIMVWFAGLDFASKLAVVGVAMTVEEAFFRGFLQPRIGIWASSAMFALGHFSYGLPFLVVGVFVVSVVLGRVYERTRDLLPCIVGHGVFDALQLFVVLPLAVQSASVQ